MQAEEEVRALKQQHEQLTSKLEARHKQQMQVVVTLTALQIAVGCWPAWLSSLRWHNTSRLSENQRSLPCPS